MGLEERAIVTGISSNEVPALNVGDVIMKIDPQYFRPTEVETLLGDPSNAKNKLGWVPEISAREMCHEMVESDLFEAKAKALLSSHGYKVNNNHE